MLEIKNNNLYIEKDKKNLNNIAAIRSTPDKGVCVVENDGTWNEYDPNVKEVFKIIKTNGYDNFILAEDTILNLDYVTSICAFEEISICNYPVIFVHCGKEYCEPILCKDVEAMKELHKDIETKIEAYKKSKENSVII